MSAAAARPHPSMHRRAMLAKVHLGAKELGLDEDSRRDLIFRKTGWRSAGDCSDEQLVDVLDELRRLGWAAKPTGGKAQPANHPVATKARALWISLWNLGAVENGSEKALEAFAKRQLGVDRLAWADQGQGYKLIEGLKAIAERHGWSQKAFSSDEARNVTSLKARLVQRQAEFLGRGPVRIDRFTDRQLDSLATSQGVEIRKAKAERAAP